MLKHILRPLQPSPRANPGYIRWPLQPSPRANPGYIRRPIQPSPRANPGYIRRPLQPSSRANPGPTQYGNTDKTNKKTTLTTRETLSSSHHEPLNTMIARKQSIDAMHRQQLTFPQAAVPTGRAATHSRVPKRNERRPSTGQRNR